MRRSREYPDQPWVWRKDWAEGAIGYSELPRALRYLAIAFLLAIPSAIVLWRYGDTLRTSSPAISLPMLTFPVAAVAMALAGLMPFLRWKTHGPSQAVLQTNPGVIGGWVRIEIQTRMQPSPSDRLTASLKCLYRTKSDRDSGQSTHVVWRLDQELRGSDVTVQDDGTASIPLSFYIPYDCIETSASQSGSIFGGSGYFWELELRARVEGPNYFAKFRVPVYKTEDSTRATPQEALNRFGETVAEQKELGATSRARVEWLPGDKLEITTPPVSWLPVKLIATAFGFACAWWLYALVQQHGVLFVPNLIALSLACGMALIVGWLWFGSRRAVFGGEALVLEHRIMWLARSRSYPIGEVTEARYGVGGHLNGREQWHVYLSVSGKDVRISTGLNAAEARLVATRIRDRLARTRGEELPLVNDNP